MSFSSHLGLMSRCLVVCALFSGQALAADFSHSYAVIVGIDDYSAVRKNSLSYARKDAKAIADFLRSQGFEIPNDCELYDQRATRHNILAALDLVALRVTNADRVLVFMAGHGANAIRGGKTWGYFVPYDGADYASYLPYTELQDASSRMSGARHQLFIIDACFSGLLLLTRSGGLSQDIPNYIDELTTRVARQGLTAGGGNQEVLDTGTNGHSVFTNALLDGLRGAADRNCDGYITFGELADYILPLASNRFQTPARGVLPGDEGGEFVFRSPCRKKSVPVTTATLPKTIVKRSITDDDLWFRALLSAPREPAALTQAKQFLQSKNYGEALPLLQKAASTGNAEAQFYLGDMYYQGRGVTQSTITGVGWYQKAATQNYAPAMVQLGSNAEVSCWNRSCSEAQQWYEKAAALNNADAMLKLGLLSEHGPSLLWIFGLATKTPDYDEARKWYEKAAAAGNVGGMKELARLYRDGNGVSRNYSQAAQWYEKAADQGDAEAMNSLGEVYASRLWFGRSVAKSRDWYQKAAAKGNSAAMTHLGYMAEGSCLSRHPCQEAYDWYEKAAALGNSLAMYDLGSLYLDGPRGLGLEPQPQSASLSFPQALFLRQDWITGRQWYEKAAKAGSSDAMYALGFLYEKGDHGVSRDYGQARQWYKQAASAGNLWAQSRLEKLPTQ